MERPRSVSPNGRLQYCIEVDRKTCNKYDKI
jgi:hypothetical protein